MRGSVGKKSVEKEHKEGALSRCIQREHLGGSIGQYSVEKGALRKCTERERSEGAYRARLELIL